MARTHGQSCKDIKDNETNYDLKIFVAVASLMAGRGSSDTMFPVAGAGVRPWEYQPLTLATSQVPGWALLLAGSATGHRPAPT